MSQVLQPYVPIAPRVKATNEKSELICQQLFVLIDMLVESQFLFNHDTSSGYLSFNFEHVNDLRNEMQIEESFNVEFVAKHLDNLIYPKFLGTKEVSSPIWNGTAVKVWQFRLDKVSYVSEQQAEDSLLEALSFVRVWRASIEASNHNPDVHYSATDLSNMLLGIEQKLEAVQYHWQHDS